jgi:hypothetical protein
MEWVQLPPLSALVNAIQVQETPSEDDNDCQVHRTLNAKAQLALDTVRTSAPPQGVHSYKLYGGIQMEATLVVMDGVFWLCTQNASLKEITCKKLL